VKGLETQAPKSTTFDIIMLTEKIRRNCLKRIKDGCSLKLSNTKKYTQKMNFVEPPAQN